MRKLVNFKEIIKSNVNLLEACGFLIPEFKGIRDVMTFGRRFLIYIVIIYSLQTASEAINIFYKTFEGLSEIIAASYLFLTHLVEFVKIVCLYKYRSNIWKLINTINRKEFQPQSDKQRKLLVDYIQLSKIITYSFWGACIATCSFWTIYPFYEEKAILPVSGWFPFNINHRWNFKIAYTYQSIAVTIAGICNIAVDTFISGLIMVIYAQLCILNDSLINIRQFAELELGLESKTCGRNNNVGNDEISPTLQYVMNRKLVECVVHHRCILEFSKEFQNIFSYSILAQFVVSVIIICVTMFELTLTRVGSIQFISIALYQYCIMLEIYLWCYFGNEVILKSNSLTKSAFHTNWIGTSTKFKKVLLYFMIRSQKVINISAGKFFTLSLQTFVSILRNSWSYFAVLLKVNNKDKEIENL